MIIIWISNICYSEDDWFISEVCLVVWVYIYKVVRRCFVVIEVFVVKLVNCMLVFVVNINIIYIDGEDEGIIVRCVGFVIDIFYCLWFSYSNDIVIRISIIRSNCCDWSDISIICVISNCDYDCFIFVVKDFVRFEGEWFIVRISVSVVMVIYSCLVVRSI